MYRLCLPGSLSAVDLGQLDKIINRHPIISSGTCVFRASEPFKSIYAVRSGSVKTYLCNDKDKERIVGFYLPGDLMGLDSIDRGNYSYHAKTLERTGICEVPFDSFEVLASRLPSLYKQMLRIMSNELCHVQAMFVPRRRNSVKALLASLLLRHSTHFKQRGCYFNEFQLSMTRRELANYLGVAVETVSRMFTKLQDEGVLTVKNKHIVVLDASKLSAIADFTIN